MALADTIEQLSFGKSMPHIDSCLGIFLSPEAIFLCEVKVDKGRPQVLHLLRLPMPGGARPGKTGATLGGDFLQDADKVAAVIQKALSEGSWRSKHAMVTLSGEFGILRYFTMPAIDRRFWRSAVPVEAKKYIPIPFATLASDYQVFPLPPGPDKKPRLGSLFGVTQRKSLESLRGMLGKLGLTLVGTELAPVSVERLWDTLAPDTASTSYAQVHFDGGHTRILVSDKGVPVFYREVALADDATVMDRRKVDLAGCVDFARKQLGLMEPRSVRVSGQIADIKSWQEAFAQDLGQPVSFQDTDKLLGLRGGQWGGYAAIGAALRHMTPAALTLDLSAVGKITDEDRRAATTILTTTGALAAVLAAVGLVRSVRLSGMESRLQRYQATTGVIPEFKGRSADQISTLISTMRDKINSFGAITAQQTPLTVLLESLAERIPDTAWITSVKYTNPLSLGGGKPDPRTIDVSGSVADKSRALEQEVAYRFGDNLRSDAVFSKAFPSVEPSVQAPLDTGGGAGGAGDAKQNTTFTIRCSSQKERSQ